MRGTGWFLCCVVGAVARGAISPAGDVDPAYPGDDPWVVAGDLLIGWDAAGTLDLGDGSRLQTDQAFLGYTYTGLGQVTVDGTGTVWDSLGDLQIGGAGIGQLTVQAGGRVTAGDLFVALDADGWGEGTVTVTGSASRLAVADELEVGTTGVGVLLIERGAWASSASGAIGAYPGSSGVVQVIDTDSLWSNSAHLYVGGDRFGPGGAGLLDVREGAAVVTADLTVWPAGRLAGNGTVAADTVTAAGTLVPDGTLTLAGDLVTTDSGVLDIRVDDQGAHDRVVVTEDATLGGGTVLVRSVEPLTQAWTYRFLEASQVSGTLTGVDRSAVTVALPQPGVPDLQLAYAADHVDLEVVLLPYDAPTLARSAHQRAVAGALQGIADRGGNAVTTTVGRLPGLAAVRRAYEDLSGRTRLVLPTILSGLDDSVQATLRRRLEDPPEGAGRVQARGGDRRSGRNAVWASGLGVAGRRTERADSPGAQWYGGGGLFGVDRRLTPGWRLGVAGGASFTRIRGRDDARTDVSAGHGGLYSRWAGSRWALDGTATVGQADLRARRRVPAVAERLDADSGARWWSAALEAGGVRPEHQDWGVTPLVGGQVTRMSLDGATERGGEAALRYGAQDWTATWGWMGVRAAGDFSYVGPGRTRVSAALRWVHAFSDAPGPLAAGFVADPQASFAIRDEPRDRDRLVLSLGLLADLGVRTQVSVSYRGQGARDRTDHALSVALIRRW